MRIDTSHPLATCVVALRTGRAHYSVRIGISPPASGLYWLQDIDCAYWRVRFLHGTHTTLAIRRDSPRHRTHTARIGHESSSSTAIAAHSARWRDCLLHGECVALAIRCGLPHRAQSARCSIRITALAPTSLLPAAARAGRATRYGLPHYQPLLEPSPNSRSERSEALRSRLFFLLRLMSSLYSGM